MWVRCWSGAHVSHVMIILTIGILSPLIITDGSSSSSPLDDDYSLLPSVAASRSKSTPVIKLEVIAILADSSNESLALSKALARSLNSVTNAQLNQVNESATAFPPTDFISPGTSASSSSQHRSTAHRIVVWRVRNFVIANLTAQHRKSTFGGSSSGGTGGTTTGPLVSVSGRRVNLSRQNKGNGTSGRNNTSRKLEQQLSQQGDNNEDGFYFSPDAMPNLCEYLARTKAVAMVNLIGDVGSERLLSIVSTSASLPLVGSAQYANPLQTHHTDKGDFYINLSTSVRHFARALGHLLIYCHWHSFAVLFDDSPSILSSQIIWEEELSQMKMGDGSGSNSNSPTAGGGTDVDGTSNYTDYDYEHPLGQGMSSVFENGDTDGLDDPVLNPDFITLRTKSSNSAFRALSELTKATQGVIVLLCSQRSLIQVFRAAQQLRMLNGDYVFILVGQYSQFEVIPDWIPSGVLALRSPRSAQIGKHTSKTTGKLLASAFVSINNQLVSAAALEEPRQPPPPRPYVNFPSASSQREAKLGPESPYFYYQQHGRKDIETEDGIAGGVFSGFRPASASDPRSSASSSSSAEQIKSFLSRGSRDAETPEALPPIISSAGNKNMNVTATAAGGRESEQSLNDDYSYPKDDPFQLLHREPRDSRKKVPVVDPSQLKPPQLVFTSAVVEAQQHQHQLHYENKRQTIVLPIPKEQQKGVQQEQRKPPKSILDLLENPPNISCWRDSPPPARKIVSVALTREMRSQMEVLASSASIPGFAFDILNLVRKSKSQREWKKVGNASVETPEVALETIRWPGGGIFGPGERASKSYRVVTIVAPPFVMEAEAEDNRTCVKGFPCLKVNTNNKDQLALIFADFDRGKPGSYRLACCDGLAMDLLSSIGRELKFEIDLYLVPDGYFGSRSNSSHWNGIMGALISGAAHMSFAPISVTSSRSTVVDFSTPYFFSGIGLLGLSRNRDVPLLAFLAPFSAQLWAAIFVALNMTAVVVALYEWFSPFGLNPWGRQRTKNFSMASALWVVWGRLFSHLVAFKAPKSWPNKFLINVWGGFSVIFVASYTANIAALFAGMFFERAVDVHDRSLLSQRVAAIKHSSADFYIKIENAHLWEHIQRFHVHSFQEGVDMLKNGSLDLLIGDKPLLDYYRGTDPSCAMIDVSEHERGDDTYAVAMARGFPLRETISSLIAKYIANGYMDYLQGKWYGQMACFRSRSQMQGARALGVEAVAGMFIMLGVGMVVGMLILVLELIVYKYALPYFRSQPKGTLWRSPNLMFFSQKLYRFINCVELVSPHHAAKELVNTLRHGQITSLFQKSVKRKEHEQRRRRKSKAQFFEMIQEIRRVQQTDPSRLRKNTKAPQEEEGQGIYSIQARLESNKQTPKVIRILGESVDYEEPPQPSQHQLALPESTPAIHQQQHRLSFQSDENLHSRKPSRSSSIFSTHRNSQCEGLSGSRVSLAARSLGDASSPSFFETGKGFFKSKSEKKPKKKASITMTTTVVKSSDKKPLKTILKKKDGGSGFNLSESTCPSSSLTAIGKKLASSASPSSSLQLITKSKERGARYRSDKAGSQLSLSSGKSEDSEDISAAEKAEILTVNLTALSKNEVIDLWKSSEAELKSQLAQALKNQEELMEKLKKIAEGQQKNTAEATTSCTILKEEELQPP